MATGIGHEPLSHLEQHEADLEVLADIAEIVANQSAPQQLLSSVLAVLERKLGMLRGTVMLLLPDGKELLVEAAQDGPAETVTGARYRAGRRGCRPGRSDRAAGGHSAGVRRAPLPEPDPSSAAERLRRGELLVRADPFGRRSDRHALRRLAGAVAGAALRTGASVGDRRRHDRVRRPLAPGRGDAPADPWKRRTSGCAMRCRSSSGPRTSSATRTACERST
jgi:hypothetical protein